MSANVNAYEKLGAFYLGRPYDAESAETVRTPLLYDAKDLLTHAVCVGMTGSGKTGLCISLLEEAAIDGIPALVIDVKGDLGNLLLNFPTLDGPEFEPWVNLDEARRKSLTAEEYAQQQADLWRNGLADWDQDGERLRRLRSAADFVIYTPGSEAGLPVSVLSSFEAPPSEVLEDGDLLRERVSTTVSGLLGLLGIEADPLRSREHILLSNLLDRSWRDGQDLDMASLIQNIQDPPIERIGVMTLESFYPSKDRFELAMTINNLLAAPGFQSWMSGEPLDVDRMLYTEQGKPRVAIFSIAHLNDAERMFFVSMLLSQTLGWMRSRSGTTSLRALLYMDEIFGYLPPVANPPSKQPLLTLLKQARAFGLGLVLATQNPVDLDYRALSNIGTWFLGRLQTERDKNRVIDGLVSAEGDGRLSRKRIERLLSGLAKRTFLLHNVHESAPVLFKVRWAMSYLRGPLTRQQIQRLMTDRKRGREAESNALEEGRSAPREPAAAVRPAAEVEQARPLLPPSIPQVFLPVAGRADATLVYQPRLVGAAEVHFVNRRKDLQASEEVTLLVDLHEDVQAVEWDDGEEVDLVSSDLESEPATEEASYEAVTDSVGKSRSYTSWKKSFADTLYRDRRYELKQCAALGLIAQPGESERDFRIRLADAAREERDEKVEKLRDKYERKLQTLEDRIRRAEQKVEREEEQAKSQKMQAVINMGTSILGAFLGRKRLSATNMRRAGSAVRGFGRSSKEAQDVERAEEDLQVLEQKKTDLEVELQEEIDALTEHFEDLTAELETFLLKPRKTDIQVQRVALAWVPYRRVAGGLEAAYHA